MKQIDIAYGEYASKWCLTDFYEESETKLKQALESNEDFDTGWFGCKKEIRYARYKRENGVFTIEVSCHMDDLYEQPDLIYDALWESCKVEIELPDDIIDSILDACVCYEIEDSITLMEELSGNATFDEIVEKTDELESEAEKANHSMFERLCAIVKDHYIYMQENNLIGGTEE